MGRVGVRGEILAGAGPEPPDSRRRSRYERDALPELRDFPIEDVDERVRPVIARDGLPALPGDFFGKSVKMARYR
ncbi:hypothetical protein [Actinomadura sp. K4S16]|uniref:hypothetical protein n=1 Tax=Actinomadura sp. K4S16 TaxID=1316147 RepID=UPI0011EF7AB4|nr:hypothetical protein [Actinomadura sp. K4S16]